MTKEKLMQEKEKHLNYYRTKFKDNFSPAMLEFHLNRLYDMAVNSYNPKKSAFPTHLASYMQKLNRVANYKGGLLKTTEYEKGLTNKVLNTYYEQKAISLSAPAPEEIAAKTGVPLKKVKEILKNNVHAAIVPGMDSSALHIDTDLVYGLDDTEKKVLETIEKDMKPEQAYKHTGLSKTKYYEIRNKVREHLRSAYLNTLKDNNVIG